MFRHFITTTIAAVLAAACVMLSSCRNPNGTGNNSAVNTCSVGKDEGDIADDAGTAPDLDSSFRIEDIPDTLFQRMQGRSFNEPSPVTREQLRLLTVLYTDFDGNTRTGRMVCNVRIAGDLLEIFRELYDNAYPIESVRLVDDFDGDDNASMRADNSSCFNVRPKSSFSSGFSAHAYGLAVDINPLYNPYVRTRDGVTSIEPEEAAPYIDRGRDFPHKIDREDLCCRLFRGHGFAWGGSWRSVKDYQHFEKSN